MRPLEPVARSGGLPAAAVADAQLLAGAVRDRDPELIEDLLTGRDQRGLYELAVTLAAMVPTDRSPTELLAWNDTEAGPVLSHSPRITAPHGTHAAYVRHRNAGESACQPCKDAERDYSRGRHRARRLRARRLRVVQAVS